MRDFLKVIRVIETDNDGYLLLKSLLPEDAIEWARNAGDLVMVKLKDDVDPKYVADAVNKIYYSLNR
jgi:hypothetical protein